MQQFLNRRSARGTTALAIAAILLAAALFSAIRVVQSIVSIDGSTDKGLVWAAIALIVLIGALCLWGALGALRYWRQRRHEDTR